MAKPKLTVEQKVAILLNRHKSLRELGDEYGVHHSVIDELFKESEELLLKYWTEKSQNVGRPSKQPDAPARELVQIEQANKALSQELALKQMRIDYLELKLKWERERAAEAGTKSPKQLKKKKR